MTARIYRPARTAMQSGKGKTKQWLLIHEPETARAIDPLMGYTSSTETAQQVRLAFDSLEAAEAYCQRNGLAYWVQPAHEPNVHRASYPDNFRADRKIPWTH